MIDHGLTMVGCSSISIANDTGLHMKPMQLRRYAPAATSSPPPRSCRHGFHTFHVAGEHREIQRTVLLLVQRLTVLMKLLVGGAAGC